MFSREKIQHIMLAAVGALVFSTASIGAAVGPSELQAAVNAPVGGAAVEAQV